MPSCEIIEKSITKTQLQRQIVGNSLFMVCLLDIFAQQQKHFPCPFAEASLARRKPSHSSPTWGSRQSGIRLRKIWL